MKNTASTSLRFIPAALGLAVCLLANNAMAQNQYFGVTAGIVNGGTYSWDAANWSVAGGSSSGPFTYNWSAGDFARFYGIPSGTAPLSYTVTVNASEANTGLYNNGAATTLNINDAGNGTGNLSLNSGLDAFITASTAYTYINVPITGPGTLCPETSGNIYFTVANSYTGGTALGESGNSLANFNNNLTFSTGPITLHRTGIANFSTLLAYGGQTLTLANNFQATSDVGTGTGLNFASAANTPVVSSGTWTLGTYNLNLRNAGGSTAPLTVSGAISGSGILALSANGTGSKTILSGANPFTGTIIVTGSSAVNATYGGSGAITLVLGAANTIASSSSVVMAGGTLDPDGFRHAMGATTLGLTASSTIDFTSGAAELVFANSSGLTWTAGQTLNLVSTTGGNWNMSGDFLVIGTDATGLAPAQLGEIEFNGTDLGDAGITAAGYIYDTVQQVPEPSTVLLSLLGGLGVMWAARRRTV